MVAIWQTSFRLGTAVVSEKLRATVHQGDDSVNMKEKLPVAAGRPENDLLDMDPSITAHCDDCRDYCRQKRIREGLLKTRSDGSSDCNCGVERVVVRKVHDSDRA